MGGSAQNTLDTCLFLDNSEYASGIFELNSYAIEEVRFNNFSVTLDSGLNGWGIY